ncbi:MAG: FHA domain-containing serine/threonine-protein kinase [Thermoanaerobaculia bacterium]|nr:FHA domain-containing serine/threonine-protein kinase [Thermoanaerobaculia bacterium]
MIGKVIGNYRVERELSEGGMSQVYVGRTVSRTDLLPEGYEVVLKVMLEELAGEVVAKKRFIKEADILSRLRHRYITSFYEFIPSDPGAVLVMEFVQGSPVDHLIAQRGALPVRDAIAIAQALLEALVYAHRKNIIHRDIKPANLILQPSGMLKVTDFGIAKMRDSSSEGQTVLTKSGFLLGTPHYMSPEQIREPKDAGPQCDVYSVAVVLYEMLTGQLPFNSKSLPKLIDAVYRGIKENPSKLRSEIDKELEGIILKGMEPRVEDRYQTAREFYEALEEYGARPMVVPPVPEPPSEHAGPGSSPAAAPAEEKKAVEWHLVSVRGDSNESHRLTADDVMVGRDRSCGIVLSHPAVSRRHARITRRGDEFVVEDLQSANGTYVNNRKIDKVSLSPGDVVRFGADPACSYVIRGRAEGNDS